MKLPRIRHYFAIYFSGVRKAGDNIWAAHAVKAPASRDREGAAPATAPSRSRLALVSLHRLAALAGTAERAPALAHLVRLVLASERALWGFDFPFGLPVELFPRGTPWADQFAFLAGWADDAYGPQVLRAEPLLPGRRGSERAGEADAGRAEVEGVSDARAIARGPSRALARDTRNGGRGRCATGTRTPAGRTATGRRSGRRLHFRPPGGAGGTAPTRCPT